MLEFQSFAHALVRASQLLHLWRRLMVGEGMVGGRMVVERMVGERMAGESMVGERMANVHTFSVVVL